MVVKRGILESEDQPAYQRRAAPRTAFTSPVLEEEVGFVMWGQQSYTWASTFFLGKWKQYYRGWIGRSVTAPWREAKIPVSDVGSGCPTGALGHTSLLLRAPVQAAPYCRCVLEPDACGQGETRHVPPSVWWGQQTHKPHDPAGPGIDDKALLLPCLSAAQVK